MSKSKLAWHFKTDVSKIGVPCGHCYECRLASERIATQKCTMQGEYSVVFMVTLTYNNKHLPVTTIRHEVSGEVRNIAHFDYTHIQKMLKRVRKYFPQPFKYLVCGERGDKGHRPHYHMLLFVKPTLAMRDAKMAGKLGEVRYRALCKQMEDELYDLVKEHWSINVGTRKHPKYEPLFTFKEKWVKGKHYRNYDLHYVDPFRDGDKHDSPYYYLAKYLVKNHEYEDGMYKYMLSAHAPAELRKRFKSFRKMSRGLGSARPIINNGKPDWCCEYADSIRDRILAHCDAKPDKFQFRDPVSGKLMPLARTYYKIIPVEKFYAQYLYLEEHPELKKSELDDLYDDHYVNAENKLRDIQRQLHCKSTLDAVMDSYADMTSDDDDDDMPLDVYLGTCDDYDDDDFDDMPLDVYLGTCD